MFIIQELMSFLLKLVNFIVILLLLIYYSGYLIADFSYFSLFSPDTRIFFHTASHSRIFFMLSLLLFY